MEDQLNRLLTQLQDLEDLKVELDEEEYASTRQDTLDQLREFEGTLGRMMAGNITLVDELGTIQLAIQAAVRSAFKSPEVIRMFAKKENGALRSRLAVLESDFKLGRVSSEVYSQLAFEILTALEKLGEELSPKELELINLVSLIGTINLCDFNYFFAEDKEYDSIRCSHRNDWFVLYFDVNFLMDFFFFRRFCYGSSGARCEGRAKIM